MKKLKPIAVGAILAASAFAFAPAQAQTIELTPEQRTEVDEFVVGAATAVMLHEVGHLLIGELDLPVIAREEDVADAIATLTLLMQDDDDDERAVHYLEAFVTNWFLSGLSEYGEIADAYVADEHSLSRQRAFSGVCLAHGSGHPAFEGYGEKHGMSEERLERCKREFTKAQRSFSNMLAPHILEEGAAQIGQPIIEYGESEDYASLIVLLKSGEFLEELAELVFDDIAMPRDVIFVADECGIANAFYAVDDDENIAMVVFCYEFADWLAEGYIDAFFGDDAIEPEDAFDALVREEDIDCPADQSCIAFKI